MSAQAQPGEGSRGRALGREIAFLAACHLESRPRVDVEAAISGFWAEAPASESGGTFETLVSGDAVARSFATLLIGALLDTWDEVDAAVQQSSSRWRLARMDPVDRNALRIACLELRADAQTPVGVVASEAVRIASRYGSETSGKFVNGVVATMVGATRGATP